MISTAAIHLDVILGRGATGEPCAMKVARTVRGGGMERICRRSGVAAVANGRPNEFRRNPGASPALYSTSRKWDASLRVSVVTEQPREGDFLPGHLPSSSRGRPHVSVRRLHRLPAREPPRHHLLQALPCPFTRHRRGRAEEPSSTSTDDRGEAVEFFMSRPVHQELLEVLGPSRRKRAGCSWGRRLTARSSPISSATRRAPARLRPSASTPTV